MVACKTDESQRCFLNIATLMQKLRIYVIGNDLNKLSPAEPWDRPPITQEDLNTICRYSKNDESSPDNFIFILKGFQCCNKDDKLI